MFIHHFNKQQSKQLFVVNKNDEIVEPNSKEQCGFSDFQWAVGIVNFWQQHSRMMIRLSTHTSRIMTL